jgi:hypothetical protein
LWKWVLVSKSEYHIRHTQQNSARINRQAQQQIINEMGTGMDIDAFCTNWRSTSIQEELLRDRMQPVSAMSNVDAEVMQRLMSAGRDGDTAIGHLTEGEVVIPAPVFEANPQAANMLEQTMTQMGIDPRTRVVDSTGEIGGIASINPETGFQEFGFGSVFAKIAKKSCKSSCSHSRIYTGCWPWLSSSYSRNRESGFNRRLRRVHLGKSDVWWWYSKGWR